MLIGTSSKRPNLEHVRMIKRALRHVLQLPDEAILMVTELACLETDCAPIETVVALMQPGEPQQQCKIHASVEALISEDLVQVCSTWGFTTQKSDFEPFLRKTT